MTAAVTPTGFAAGAPPSRRVAVPAAAVNEPDALPVLAAGAAAAVVAGPAIASMVIAAKMSRVTVFMVSP
jgi:hypothetical protein